MCQTLPRELWSHIRSYSGDTYYEPTPTASILKDLFFFSDYGDYNFPHCGRDGYVSTVVFALHAHFKKISRYNQTMFGDHTYGTVPVDYLRFVHVDRDGYAIKAVGPRLPHPYLNPDSSPPIDVLLQ